jgi:cytochrome c551/c552
VHPVAYYTLNSIPEGQKLSMREVSTKSSASEQKAGTAKATTITAAKPTAAKPTAASKISLDYEKDIKPLLAKNTCLACHNTDKKQVGLAFRDVARRKYTNKQIVELIHEPKPENWPDYATPMPPMPQVPDAEAIKIATWINTLK